MMTPVHALGAHQLLRLPAVIALTGLSRSTIYRLMQEDAFPKGLKPSTRTIAWKATDIAHWIESRDIRE